MSWQKDGRTNPYKPPEEDSERRLRNSDLWGEKYRPPTTDWSDFAFVMTILTLAFFSPVLIEWLAQILRGWFS